MGLGSSLEADFNRIIPNREISFRLGAIKPFPYNKDTWLYRQLDAFLEGYKLTMDCCYNDLPEKRKWNSSREVLTCWRSVIRTWRGKLKNTTALLKESFL